MTAFKGTPRFFSISYFLRSAVLGFSAAGLFYVYAVSSACAQQPPRNDNRYEVIDAEEGERRMAAFRRQRLDGDYCFRFVLEHLPRRGKSVRYFGIMWGSWNEEGPISRIELSTEPESRLLESDSVLEMIFQNGPRPKAWLRSVRGDDFQELSGVALLQPILPDIVYTPFDLQMPFLYWDDFTYKGPVRVKSRVAQSFVMSPPEGMAGMHPVRVGIDDAYNALLRIEVLAEDEEPRSKFTVESFKKVQEQWIVKRIVLKDTSTGDRTRFQVQAASVGLILPEQVFVPQRDVSFPIIPEAMFDDV